jgi:hypothetical protein
MIILKVSASAMLMIFSFSFVLPGFEKALASLELGSLGEMTKNFTENLNSYANKLVSEAVNNTSMSSSTSMLSNGSNISSSQVVILSNQNLSDRGTSILNQIENRNGNCRATAIGGPGNDTLSSEGVCDDQVTGGLGADKFICGQGNDTIRDYNPDEGDIIVDQGNCEIIT